MRGTAVGSLPRFGRHCSRNSMNRRKFGCWFKLRRATCAGSPGISCLAGINITQIADIRWQRQPAAQTYRLCGASLRRGDRHRRTRQKNLQQHLSSRLSRKLRHPGSQQRASAQAPSQIKHRLQKQNLALILEGCEPYPELVNFCRKLAGASHTGWITDAPLEPPLKGSPRNQPNLAGAIQRWLDEMG